MFHNLSLGASPSFSPKARVAVFSLWERVGVRVVNAAKRLT
jgi:hypothetical protein